jgi:hypothetical protein
MPQLIETYRRKKTAPDAALASSFSLASKNRYSSSSSIESSVSSSSYASNSSDDQESFSNALVSNENQQPYEANKYENGSTSLNAHDNNSNNENNISSKYMSIYAELVSAEEDLLAGVDLVNSSTFLAKFLLAILDRVMRQLARSYEFNPRMQSSSALCASAASAQPSVCRMHQQRDACHTQHLLANYMLYMMYFVQSGSYNRLTSCIAQLLGKKYPANNSTDKSAKSSPPECFDFNAKSFLVRTNRFVLFRLCKTEPFISCMWQYMLALYDFSDSEYWSLSFKEATIRKSEQHGIDDEHQLNILDINKYNSKNYSETAIDSSANSSINNSLNPAYQHQSIDESQEENRMSSDDDEEYKKRLRALDGKMTRLEFFTLNEKLFKSISLGVYCELVGTRSQLDNTTPLTMLLINNLVELFELSEHESSVLDLFGHIHRNASASSLFVHSINSSWPKLLAKRRLNLLHACLKCVEGIHLSSSGLLLTLLIEKYFDLPYLSLVKYADYIACQRVEMINSLPVNEIAAQLSEQTMRTLHRFVQMKSAQTHKRLVSLLEQLQQSLTATATTTTASEVSQLENNLQIERNASEMKPSASIDFFMLYLNTSIGNNSEPAEQSAAGFAFNYLDKEWYYNIVRSACSHSSAGYGQESGGAGDSSGQELLINDNIQLKSKQCALILANLDLANLASVLSSKNFKIGILKECLLLGANRTQSSIERLPAALKRALASNADDLAMDFMHPLWVASEGLLFEALGDLCSNIPKPPSGQHSSSYESKLRETCSRVDFYSNVLPLVEAINAFLKCIRQYPSLQHQLSTSSKQTEQNDQLVSDRMNDLIHFITFQLSLVNHISNYATSMNISAFTNANSSTAVDAVATATAAATTVATNSINASTNTAACSMNARQLGMNTLAECLLCVYNMLVDSKLLNKLCTKSNYSTLIARIVADLYAIYVAYFLEHGDENLIHTPHLEPRIHVDYSNGIYNYSSDMLFGTHTFNTLLKLRYLLTSHEWSSHGATHSTSSQSSAISSATTNANSGYSSMMSSFCASTSINRYLQEQTHYFRAKMPLLGGAMRDLIDKIFLSICRLPVLDRFMRIPDSLWRSGSFRLDYAHLLKKDSSSDFHSLPPLDYLKDSQLLKEHLKHILTVGWMSRTQFEYEYVNMLTLLHNLLDDYYADTNTLTSSSGGGAGLDAADHSSSQGPGGQQAVARIATNLPAEEIKERNKCICLIIKGLSSWLIKSTLAPKSGSIVTGLYEQVSRNKVPAFMHTELGRKYSHIKRLMDSYARSSMFAQQSSISISNNASLLYMLDPTIIDEIEQSKKAAMQAVERPHRQYQQRTMTQQRDFTQPQPTEALANLFHISMNLSQRDYTLLFSANIERTMLANLAANSHTYYSFGQVSLEGFLKFLGQWNRPAPGTIASTTRKPQTTASTIAASLSSLVTGASTPSGPIVEEMSTKTTSAVNTLLKVVEFFAEDTDLFSSTSSVSPDSQSISQSREQTTANSESTGMEALLAQSHSIQRSFNRNNLDITSVLRTILDYYESFFRHPCWQLKIDIVKSIVYLANSLFDSREQYESLMHKLQSELEWVGSFAQQDYEQSSTLLMPAVNELVDDSVLSLTIYAECLCKCCLLSSKQDYSSAQLMSSKDLDRLNRILENGFRSGSLSMKMATVHGLFYWLESIAHGYISNTNESRMLVDHLCRQISQMRDIGVYVTTNSRYVSALWSAAFYAIENCMDSIRDAQNFVGSFIKQTCSILVDPNTPYFLFYQMCMGLERFLLANIVPSSELSTIQRLLATKFIDEQRTLCMTSLIITSLYASNQIKPINYWTDIVQQNQQQLQHSYSSMNNLSASASNSNLSSAPDESPTTVRNPADDMANRPLISGYPQILELGSYPELQSHLLKVLEVATSFLDKMKSSATAKEASVYASILPKILCDFLPPNDLLNKLITEFLNSSQHPYPEAVAYVLYKCFDLLQEKGLQAQIQEWCLLSLSNFLQRTNIYESIWLTSCLLVSATRNLWLKSTFPFLLNRHCLYETLDKAIFYMSVIEFCKQFNDIAHVRIVITAFETVARSEYQQLIKLLNASNSLNKKQT